MTDKAPRIDWSLTRLLPAANDGSCPRVLADSVVYTELMTVVVCAFAAHAWVQVGDQPVGEPTRRLRAVALGFARRPHRGYPKVAVLLLVRSLVRFLSRS